MQAVVSGLELCRALHDLSRAADSLSSGREVHGDSGKPGALDGLRMPGRVLWLPVPALANTRAKRRHAMLDPEQVHDQLLELQADVRLLWRHVFATQAVMLVLIGVVTWLAIGRGSPCG